MHLNPHFSFIEWNQTWTLSECFSISRVAQKTQREGDHLFLSTVFNWITAQSGSIYAEQLDPALFVVNAGHVMRSCYWNRRLSNFLRCHAPHAVGREKTLVISEADTLSPCRHLRALYQDANELTFNTSHQSHETSWWSRYRRVAVEVCLCVWVSIIDSSD